MKDKSITRKVILLNEKLASPKETKQKKDLLLPGIKFTGNGDLQQSETLILLKDGGYRKVFQVDGFDLVQFEENFEVIDKNFKQLIDVLSCHIQIVVTSRPLPSHTAEKYRDLLGVSENDYLKWFADYTAKWFWRVATVSYLPRRKFYIVLTVPGATTTKKAVTPQTFDRAIAKCLQGLRDLGLEFSGLNKDAVRSLLTHTFLIPASNSETLEIKDAPECLSPSSLMEPDSEVRSEQIQIGDLFHGAKKISQLPAEIKFGWLANLATVMVPYTISVHFHPCPQGPVKQLIRTITEDKKIAHLNKILDGSNKAVDISIYFASFGKTSDELNSHLDDISQCFGTLGAKVSPALREQKAAWRSTLPLGLDELGACHRVSSDIASTCWPAIKVVPEQKTGIPIGFGAASREIFFVDPSAKTNYLAVSARSDDRETLCTLLALRHLTLGFGVGYIGASGSCKFLPSLLGPDISEEIKIGQISQTTQINQEKNQWSKLFTLINSEYASTLKKTGYEPLIAGIKLWLKAEKQVLFIEDGSLFFKTPEGIDALKKILALTRLKQVRVFLAMHPQDLQAAAALLKSFSSQLVFPAIKQDFAALKKYLRVPTGTDLFYDNSLLVIEPTGRCLLHWLWSPMEAGILGRSHVAGADSSAYKQRLIQLKAEAMNKNPKLPETDGWRQAVYYFGLQSNS